MSQLAYAWLVIALQFWWHCFGASKFKQSLTGWQCSYLCLVEMKKKKIGRFFTQPPVSLLIKTNSMSDFRGRPFKSICGSSLSLTTSVFLPTRKAIRKMNNHFSPSMWFNELHCFKHNQILKCLGLHCVKRKWFYQWNSCTWIICPSHTFLPTLFISCTYPLFNC